MIVSLSFLQNDEVLLVAFMGGSVRLYSSSDLSAPSRVVVLGHGGVILGCRSLPDQQFFATVSQDKTIKIWSYGDSIDCVSTLEGHDDMVVSVCFSPDQSYCFSGSKDKTMCVWKFGEEPRRIATVLGFENTVFDIAHHPTLNCIVACCGDGHVCVWDYESAGEKG
jgi:WD40 repeat protein